MTPDEAHRIVSEPRFNTNSAAAKLGVSPRTVERLRNSGALKYRRVGGKVEHTETHLAEYLQSVEREAVPAPRQRSRPTPRPARCPR
jgi:Mn-dependent DtxR family transcriptional regulator